MAVSGGRDSQPKQASFRSHLDYRELRVLQVAEKARPKETKGAEWMLVGGFSSVTDTISRIQRLVVKRNE